MMQFELLEAASASWYLREAENAPYKVVATQFRLLGFEHTQLRRVGRRDLFSKQPGLRTLMRWCGFKSTRLQRFWQRLYGWRVLSDSAQWGTEGWTYPKLEQAERKFRELVKEHEKDMEDR